MKHTLLILASLATCAFSRTPIDTLAIERSDSGSHYVPVHIPQPTETSLYVRLVPESIPEDTTIELVDTTKGRGTAWIPGYTVAAKYSLEFTGYSSVSSTWTYTLLLDADTLFSGTYSSAKTQAQNLSVFCDTTLQKLYIARTTRDEAASVTTIDSVAYPTFGNPHRVRWTLNVSNPARLLGVRGYIQK
jgi:hypothetical protein